MRKKGKRKQQRATLEQGVMNHRANALARHQSASEIRFLRRLALSERISFDFQVVFGFYIADFVFPTKMLIIELDGKNHNLPKQIEHDKRRDAYLKRIGFVVWRVPNTEAGSFDLDLIHSFADRPGYQESVATARKSYMNPQAFHDKQERREYLQKRDQVLTESVQQRRQQKATDMTPRLVKQYPEAAELSELTAFDLAVEKDRTVLCKN